MNKTIKTFCCLILLAWVLLPQETFVSAAEDDSPQSPAETSAAQRLEFFEERIRPVLVDYCYKCHSEELDEAAGELRLNTREGIRRGGLSGPAVVPGDVDESLLYAAMQYSTLQMPPDEKLPDEVIADFRKWIADGAVDSRSEQPDQPTDAALTVENCATDIWFNPAASVWLISAAPVQCWPNALASVMFVFP